MVTLRHFNGNIMAFDGIMTAWWLYLSILTVQCDILMMNCCILMVLWLLYINIMNCNMVDGGLIKSEVTSSLDKFMAFCRRRSRSTAKGWPWRIWTARAFSWTWWTRGWNGRGPRGTSTSWWRRRRSGTIRESWSSCPSSTRFQMEINFDLTL